jgi:hypothetical protein
VRARQLEHTALEIDQEAMLEDILAELGDLGASSRLFGEHYQEVMTSLGVLGPSTEAPRSAGGTVI